ncbi:MAG: DinB family protein [Anaerolineales bacterium]
MSQSQRSDVVNAIPSPRPSLVYLMTLTLLLDLDDTLLGNSMDTFIPAYLQALSEHLEPFIPPEDLVSTLLSGTQAMMDNNLPDRTLKEAFDQAFYPSLGIDQHTYVDKFDSFYTEIFPKLKYLTQTRPEAVGMVEEAFNHGYTVAIATNPLFPRKAILQRLEWAGLSPQNYPFRLIPSYETFHFAKPNPAFFTETLACLGWLPGPVVMVGDDFDHDIAPARLLGFGNYWVTDVEQDSIEKLPGSAGYGGIEELISWIDSIPGEDLHPDFGHIETMVAVLRATPAVVHAFSQQLDSANWVEHPQPGEWSYTEILCHLRDVDSDVNIPRIKKVLEEVNPFLPGIDSDKWAHERLYYCQSGPDALRDFTSSRIQLLEVLDSLEAPDWDRPARHAIFGPTNLKELVSIIVGHDQLHTQQAFRFLGDLSKRTVTQAPGLQL